MNDLASLLPAELASITSLDTAIPKLAKDEKILSVIEQTLRNLPTAHKMYCYDSRNISFLEDNTIHLVVTSPPYWTLKRYNEGEGQLGHVEDYAKFLDDLDKVWQHCFRTLVPGGRLICVVGDVCLSRKSNNGEHTVVPLHASIQEHCKKIGFSNLAPIIWHKIANAKYEVEGNSRFLGKPYEPNGVIKNDIEYILMLRKPGGYRSPSREKRLLSVIPDKSHKLWFQQIWEGITGASTKEHPAPYPLELADRLIRMFSFADDVVLDPFMGSGTTILAAAIGGRNGIGIELDPEYLKMARVRFENQAKSLFAQPSLDIFSREDIDSGKIQRAAS